MAQREGARSSDAPGAEYDRHDGKCTFEVLAVPNGGAAGADADSATSSAVPHGVEQHFTAQTVGGTTIYDLT